jgi:hypothetical protein
MVAFIQYLHLEQLRRPHLFFRIADVDLKLDAGTNMNNMLAPKTDHYQSIRDAIKLLFSSASAVKTVALDRSEKNLLNNHLYKGMLITKENGFNDAIEDLTSILGKKLKTAPRTFSEWTTQVSTLIDLINCNEKIDYKKLDVVELLAFKEITEFINKVDPSLYEPIKVNGTHAMYMTNVHTRLTEATRILDEFKRHFSAISDCSGEKGRRFLELQERLIGPVDNATKQTIRMARAAISNCIETHFKGWTYFTDNGARLINPEHDLWSSFNAKYKKIHDEINGKYYNHVVEEFEGYWSNTIINNLKKHSSQLYDNEIKDLDRVMPLIKEYLERTLPQDIMTILIKENLPSDLRRPVSDILKEMGQKVMDKFITKITEMEITSVGIDIYIHIITGSVCSPLMVDKFTKKMTKIETLEGTVFFDLVEDAKKGVVAATADAKWHKILLGKRRQMLRSMKITTDVSPNNLLIVNNPHVQFVEVYLKGFGYESRYIITQDEFKKEERLILRATLDKLIKKGIIQDRFHGYNYLYRTGILHKVKNILHRVHITLGGYCV